MSRKNFLIIFAVFIFLIALGNVSANDIDDNLDNLTDTSDDDIVLSSESSNDILTEGEGSLSDLQNEINSNGNSFTLSRDYKYKSGDSVDGIKITKTFTLEGNGKTIDACGMARVFNITGNDVTIKNIIIKNAFINNTINLAGQSHKDVNISSGNGAGILWTGNNGFLSNSQIINATICSDVNFENMQDVNVGYYMGNGAGVYWTGENGKIENTRFTNNTLYTNLIIKYNTYSLTNCNITRVIGNGVALVMSGNNSSIRKSIFTNNKQNWTYNTTDINGAETNVNIISNTNVSLTFRGGSVWLKGDCISVSDSEFNGNDVMYGGAIFWTGHNGTLTKSTLKNNNATYYGAIYWTGDNGTLKSSSFNNNTATQDASFHWTGSNGLVSDSTFTNSTGSSYRGGFEWLGVNGRVINCNFINLTTGGNEAVFYWRGTNGTIDNCNFINNTARSMNGAGGFNSLHGQILNSQFINNHVSNGYGGAIRLGAYSITVDNCTFVNNSASTYGGAIYVVTCNDNIVSNSKFINNTAGTSGDAIFVNNGLGICVENNIYTNNANDFTDAIMLENHDFYIEPLGIGTGTFDSPCDWSYAYTKIAHGNKIILLSGTYYDIVNQIIDKSIIVEGQNDAVIDLNSTGRAFTISSYRTTISNIKFINGLIKNSNGGAISWSGAYGTINNAQFINNTAILNYNVTYSTVQYTYGGAIYWSGSHGSILNSNFINNTAEKSNDIYYTNPVLLNDNIFIGDYIDINNRVVVNHEDAFIKVTAPNENITVKIILNGEEINNYNIIANTSGNSNLILGNVNPNDYTLNISFISSNNKYINNAVKTIRVLGSFPIIYVDSVGGGTGEEYTSPTDISTALNNAIYGTEIVFINGTLNDIVNVTVSVSNIVIRGSGNTTLDAMNNGRIFYIFGNNVTIRDLTFINGNNNFGGAIYWIGENGSLYDSLFINCTSNSGSGGSIYWWGANATIYNSTFINNTASTVGGALIIKSSANVQNSRFSYNKAGTYGGAIRNDGSFVNIINSTFVNNFAYNYGGAISATTSNTVISSYFINNSASGTSGTIDWRGANAVLMNSTIINSKSGTGGAMYWTANDGVVINSTFINCTTNSGSGGAIYWLGENAKIIGSSFISNTASTWGGAVIFKKYAMVHNSTFKNNKATEGGGALNIDTKGINLTSSIFINNTSISNRAGAVTITGTSNSFVVDCTFVKNNASTQGGAIYVGSVAVVIISDSNFEDNVAFQSNDIYAINNVTLNYNIFKGSYLDVSDEVSKYYEGNFSVKATASNQDVVATLIMYGSNTESIEITIKANTTGDNLFTFPKLDAGEYIFSLMFSSGNNYYYNTLDKFIVVKDSVFWVSVDGKGTGDTNITPTNLTYALDNSIFGTQIYLLNGIYNIVNQTINVTGVNIRGAGNNVTFDAQKSGRILIINSDYVVLENITFANGYATGNYGAIYLTNSKYCNIINCSFINNSATLAGALGAGYSVTVNKCSFINNTARTSSGGAIHAASDGRRYFIYDSIFKNNTCAVVGSAVRIYGSSVVQGCIFENNRASGSNSRGTIYTETTGYNSISSCIFRYNYATTGGAGICLNSNNNKVLNCIFESNEANYGGAIYTSWDNIINNVLNNCSFISNVANKNGGAIYFNAITYNVLNNSVFINNTAKNSMGGAIYGFGNGLILNSNFTNNSASTFDIYRIDSNLNITNNRFFNSFIDISESIVAHYSGIAGYLKIISGAEEINATLIINKAGTVTNIPLIIDAGSSDVGFYLSSLDAGNYIIDVTFESNNNKYFNNKLMSCIVFDSVFWVTFNGTGNGSLRTLPTNLTYALEHSITGTTINLIGNFTNIVNQVINQSVVIVGWDAVLSGNNANRIFQITADNVILQNLTICNGKVTGSNYGAAIKWTGNYGVVSNCIFKNNLASGDNTRAGAIHWAGNYGLVVNCTFTNNQATKYQGVFRWEGSNGQIIDSNITNNKALYEAVGYWVGDNGLVKNCNFINNTASTYYAGVWSINNCESVSIISCNFTNNTAGTIGGAVVVSSNGKNCIISDCNFMNNKANVGGAIYWSGTGGVLTRCNFTDNIAVTCNDVYLLNGTNAVLSNNIFIGDYSSLQGTFAPKLAILSIGVTADSHNINTIVYANGVSYRTVVSANTIGNTLFDLSSLSPGFYNLNMTFISTSTNKYINRMSNFTVVSGDIYVSPDGMSTTGDDPNNPTNWTHAMSILYPGMRIILSGDIFSEFYNKTISCENVTVVGSRGTVLDANGKGRIFRIDANGVVLENITFINGKMSTSSSGFAVYLGSSQYVTVFNCSFINNAGGYGALSGGMYVTVRECTFIKNSGVSGGAIHTSSNDGTYYIYDSIFRNNTASNYGSTVRLYNNCIVQGCIFEYNNATGSGRAVIAVGGGSNNLISSCSFRYNYASSNSGAILINCGSNTIYNCTFESNEANNGGAIFLDWAASNSVINNCSFINNIARSNGGAIYVDGNSNNINNFVSNSIFINNAAKNSWGGAIYWLGSSNKGIIDSKFYNNSASTGSAIYTTKNIPISNSIFLDNRANSKSLTLTNIGKKNITVVFNGNDNILNAIYASVDLTSIKNVDYLGGEGVVNTGSSVITLTRSNVGAGQKVIFELYDKKTNELIENITKTTGDDGIAVLNNVSVGSYLIKIYHPLDTYYTFIKSNDVFLEVNGTFNDLSNLLQNTSKSVLDLHANYVFDSEKDLNLVDGIVIDRNITIDGNGYIIDASNLARIFNITADGVVLNNMSLINGNSSMGGALYWFGSNGEVNNVNFYNNSVSGNGSAIYTINSLTIFNSEFLDDTANVDFSYTKSNNGFTVHMVSGDNYINAIYALDTPIFSNITYWGTTGKVVNSDSALDSDRENHNLTVNLYHKVNETPINTSSMKTNADGNISVSNLKSGVYYGVDVRHYTGSSKFSNVVFDVPVGVSVSKLELFVPESVEVGDNLTVVALLSAGAGGNVTFTINGTLYTVDVVDGRAVLSVNPNLPSGSYEIDAVFNSNDTGVYYGQRNSTEFTVKVKTPATITVVAPETSLNNTELTLKALTNFESAYKLQLVVRLFHFSCNTLSVGLF